MKGRYFRLLLNRAKAFPSLRPALSCRLLLALLVLVLSVGGTTYAWMTSRGVVNSASVHVEKIKVSAGGLTIRGDGEWKPLDLEDSCIVSFDKLIKAAEAKERLSAAYQIPNSPYPSSSYTFDGDLESVMEAQFFFKVENLGDEAFAFVETNDMLGVSFANNAFMLPLPEDEAYDNNDFIWFEDVVLESYGILGTIVESEYITAKDIQSAIYELKELLEVSESILESQAYPDLLEDYEETFLAAAADPSDDNIAAAAGAKAALDESAQAALTNYKAAKESVEYDSSRLYNMQQMLAALNTVTYAINDAANDAAAEAVITDRRYIEVLEDEKLRPLRLAELDEIFEIEEERNINVRAFLRYGDLATQVGVTPIIKALAREDFGAHIIHMTSESLIDVAFELSLPDAASSEKDNAFNGAKLWLGKDGACVSAVGSDAALNDVFGVLLEESPDNIFTATQTISDEITLSYDQISLVRTTDDALFIEDALGYENP